MALVSFDFALLLSIFLWILVGMLIGLAGISMNFQGIMEIIVVHVFCCC